MLVGLMDHWVPSHENISQFWKTPFEVLQPEVEALCDELALTNFTFYTKWATNGIKSSLPFLRNDPAAQNVLTDNAWGQQWIDFFHQRGMTVGAMLQCYQLEGGTLTGDAVLGPWEGTSYLGDTPRDMDVLNPLWEGYPSLFEAMLREHLRAFPDLDAIFFEFEGLTPPKGAHALRTMGDGQDVSPEIRRQWEESGWSVPAEDQWIWTPSVQQALCEKLTTHLALAERIMREVGFTGTRGVVVHALGYESTYVTHCLPTPEWWLLPWHYWGWGTGAPLDDIERQQLAWCQRHLRSLKEQGYHICYIGNATLPTLALDSITDMVRFSKEIDADGYLGMGNPIPTYGLRWLEATEASVAEIRQLYRELFPR
ncbi:MAG: hypothetical protein ACYDBB_07215 [Armatimonadota bacterium]